MAILLVVWCWAAPAGAQGQDIIVAAWIFPPYAYADGTGGVRGPAVEAVENILKAMGYRPRMALMPFKRCLTSMQDGLMPVMLPCAISEERAQYMRFSDPVYHITTMLWKKGGDLSGCWQDYDDLAGLRIGVGLGYSYGEKWAEAVASKKFTLAVASGASAELTHFRMTAEDRIDMFICDESVGRFIKAEHAPQFDDIHPCPKKIGKDRAFGAAVSRRYFKEHGLSADAFLERFNAFLEEARRP